MTSAMDSGRFTLLEENGGAAISCCIVPTPKPILPQWTCSVYCTTPWICPATTLRNGMNGRDEWHGEAMSTIKGPGSGARAARGGREGSNQRGSDAPAQDAVERHEPAATEHASREIPEQEACGEDDAGRSGIVLRWSRF